MKRLAVALTFLMSISFFLPPKPTALADLQMPAPLIPIVHHLDYREMALGKYFEQHNCPLLPYVDDFITAADNAGIDWRLLPAISIHESTCGKRYPINTNNPFGWLEKRQGGELTVAKFKSVPDAINFITGQLQNGKYYAGKSIRQKLATYCPSPNYPQETINYMNLIYEYN